MKVIKKRKDPLRLREWRKATRSFRDASYDTHQFPKEEVKSSLVAEQGGLCAYTMIRIDEASSHIEHLKPRTISKEEGCLHETTDYANNLVACFPNTGLADSPACPFGADFKKSQWDRLLFITPLNGTCEARFQFHTDGTVSYGIDDTAAEWTYKALNLNEPTLVDLRKAEIRRLGLSPNADAPVTLREAKEIAEKVCRLTGDRFDAFCVAIRHAALEYASKLEKMSQKRKYAAQSQTRKDR
jgi:uncharacterized protein (TIGR02646 family)